MMKRLLPSTRNRLRSLKTSLSLVFIFCLISESLSQEMIYGSVIKGSLANQKNVSAQDNVPTGIAFNDAGSKCFIAGAGTKTIYEYSLTTNFDLSTATATANSLSVNTQLSVSVTDLAFSSDGLKLYATGRQFNIVTEVNQSFVVEYSLGTAYDISTVGSNTTLFVNNEEALVEGIAFNNDGTKLFIIGSGSNAVREYALSTGFDLSTSSASSVASATPSTDSNYTGIAFNLDGSRMYLSGTGDSRIDEFYLSSAFDLSDDVTFLGDFDPSLSPQDIVFNTDQDQLIVAGTSGFTPLLKSFDLDVSGAFKESTSKDGSVTGSAVIYLIGGETFTNVGGVFTNGTDYTIDNLPAGLSSSIDVTATDELTLSILGMATDHQSQNTIENLKFTFANSAFTGGDASTVSYAVAYSTPFSIDFDENAKFYHGFKLTSTINVIDPRTAAGASVLVTSLLYSPNGSQLLVGTINGSNGEIYVYDLSTPYDIATAVYNSDVSLTVYERWPREMRFNGDGSLLLVSGNGSNTGGGTEGITQFSLSTPYDVTTLSFAHKLSLSGAYTFDYNADGSVLYVGLGDNTDIQKYILSSPYDLSTATFAKTITTFSIVAEESNGVFNTLRFNEDGTILYLLESAGLQKIKLSTPYDLESNVTRLSFQYITLSTRLGAGCFDFDPTEENFVIGRPNSFTRRVYGFTASPQGFEEVVANDGSVTGLADVTLSGDLFRTDGALAYGADYTIDNLPAGLAASLTVAADSLSAELQLSGNATNSNEPDEVNDLKITFTASALKSGNLTGVFNTTNASIGSGISFINSAFDVTLSTGNLNPTQTPVTVNAEGSQLFQGLEGADFSISNGTITGLEPIFSQEANLTGFSSSQIASAKADQLAVVNFTETIQFRQWGSSFGTVNHSISVTDTNTPQLIDVDADANGHYYFYDYANGKVLIYDTYYNKLGEVTGLAVNAFRMAVNKEGTQIALTTGGNEILTYDLSGTLLATISVSDLTNFDVAFDPEGDIVIAGTSTNDEKIQFFDGDNYSLLGAFEGQNTNNLTYIDCNGDFLFISQNVFSGGAWVFDAYTDGSTKKLDFIKTLEVGQNGLIRSIAASGNYFYAVLSGGSSRSALDSYDVKIEPATASSPISIQLNSNTVTIGGTPTNNASNTLTINFSTPAPEITIATYISEGESTTDVALPFIFSSNKETSFALSDVTLTNATFQQSGGANVELGEWDIITSYGSNGTGAEQFDAPWDICANDNYIAVADRGNNRVHLYDSAFQFVKTITAGFNTISGVHIHNHKLYVSDQLNHRVVIYDLITDLFSELGTGSAGSGNTEFNNPISVFVDSSGKLYVGDRANGRVQIFDASLNYESTLSGVTGLQDAIMDEVTNRIIVSDYNNGKVVFYDATTKTFIKEVSGIGFARKIELNAYGEVYVAGQTTGIYLIGENGIQDQVSLTNSPIGLAFSYSGDLLVTRSDADVWQRFVPDNSIYAIVEATSPGTVSVAIAAGVITDNYNQTNTPQSLSYIFTSPTIQWTGTTSTDWHTATNWSGGTVPVVTDDVIIGATATNQPIITDEAAVNNITVNTGATLTIEREASLAIMGTATGDVIAKKNLSGNQAYNIITSPVADVSFGDLAANFVYDYDGTNFFVPTGNMVAAKGYFVSLNTVEPTVIVTGVANSGTQTVAVSDAGDAFNIVANPYLAAIDRAAFVAANTTAMDGNIWLWNDGFANVGGNRGGDYILVNNMGVASAVDLGDGVAGQKSLPAPNTPITSFQGFLVNASANANVVFQPTMQVTTAGSNADGNFYRKDIATQEYATIKLSLSDSENYNEIIVGLAEEATFGKDYALDGQMYSANPDFAFYSKLDDQPYSIQALPLAFEDELEVSLGMDIRTSGQYILKVEDISSLENFDVFLKHQETGKLSLIDEMSSIDLSLQSGSNNQYSLVFVNANVLSIDVDTTLKLYGTAERLTVQADLQGAHEMLIYDLTGRKHFQEVISFDKGKAIVPVTLQKGKVYVLRLEDQSIKFILK